MSRSAVPPPRRVTQQVALSLSHLLGVWLTHRSVLCFPRDPVISGSCFWAQREREGPASSLLAWSGHSPGTRRTLQPAGQLGAWAEQRDGSGDVGTCAAGDKPRPGDSVVTQENTMTSAPSTFPQQFPLPPTEPLCLRGRPAGRGCRCPSSRSDEDLKLHLGPSAVSTQSGASASDHQSHWPARQPAGTCAAAVTRTVAPSVVTTGPCVLRRAQRVAGTTSAPPCADVLAPVSRTRVRTRVLPARTALGGTGVTPRPHAEAIGQSSASA